jgi:nucleotide-binding universal stress UspA family protein
MMSTTPDRRRIVVGFDGSEASTAALDWALAEAIRRDLAVHALVAKSIPYSAVPQFGVMGPWPADLSGGLRDAARSRARQRAPHVTFSTEEALGSPAAFLVQASRSADMVVVGRGRHSMLGEAVRGSTSAQVVGHATCPVVVVQSGDSTDLLAPIVVAVDGSDANEQAVAFAFDRAAALGAPVVAVHAWWIDIPDRLGVSALSEDMVTEIERRHRALLDDVLATWSAKYPTVPVQGVMVRDRPVDAVVRAAGYGAQLIVVGSRGHGGFTGLLVGSVSQGLLHHDRPCPLAVVHPGR